MRNQRREPFSPQSFIVGAEYSDRCGTYTVLPIVDDQLWIRYKDGSEVFANAKLKARIYANVLRRFLATAKT